MSTSVYSWLAIDPNFNFAVIHTKTGLVYECETYKSAERLKKEVGGVIVRSDTLAGILAITRARRMWGNIPLPNKKGGAQ